MNLKKLSKVIRPVLWIGLIGLILLVTTNLWVVLSTQQQLFTDISSIPENDVALVLGTSNRLSDGTPNPYFRLRIEKAAELYKAGKVKHIIVSGDNSSQYYNEPQKMSDALVLLGIPSKAITLDYAGLRTLDSIVRGKKIFGQEKITIITQPFHAYRALFISNYYGMNAIAMATEKLPQEISIAVQVREIFARPLAVWDLYIIKKEPKHLGKKEELQIKA